MINMTEGINVISSVSSEQVVEDGTLFSCHHNPTIVPPTSNFERKNVVMQATLDESHSITMTTTTGRDYDNVVQNKVNGDDSQYKFALRKAQDDTEEAVVALDNLVQGIKVVRRFLQIPIDVQDQDQRISDRITELSNHLVGVLGSELMGLMNDADMVRDHARLHSKEASHLLEDLHAAKDESNKSNERADMTETICRQLYTEKQILLEQVTKLTLERRALIKEVKSLRRDAQDTKKFDTWRLLEEHVLDAVAIHEMVMKTPTTHSYDGLDTGRDVVPVSTPTTPRRDYFVCTDEVEESGIVADVGATTDYGHNETTIEANEAVSRTELTADVRTDEKENGPPDDSSTTRDRVLTLNSGMNLGFGRFKRNPSEAKRLTWGTPLRKKGDNGYFFKDKTSGNNVNEILDKIPSIDVDDAITFPREKQDLLEEVTSTLSPLREAEQERGRFSTGFGRFKMLTQHHAARVDGRLANVLHPNPVNGDVSSSNDYQTLHTDERSSSEVVGSDRIVVVSTHSDRNSNTQREEKVADHLEVPYPTDLDADSRRTMKSNSSPAEHVSILQSEMGTAAPSVSPRMTPTTSPQAVVAVRTPSSSHNDNMKPVCDPRVLRTLAIPSEDERPNDFLLLSPLSPVGRTNILYEC